MTPAAWKTLKLDRPGRGCCPLYVTVKRRASVSEKYSSQKSSVTAYRAPGCRPAWRIEDSADQQPQTCHPWYDEGLAGDGCAFLCSHRHLAPVSHDISSQLPQDERSCLQTRENVLKVAP